jgi:hypothetical protein
MDRRKLGFGWLKSNLFGCFIFFIVCALLGGRHFNAINFSMSLLLAMIGMYLAGTAVTGILSRLFPAFLLQQGLALRVFIGQWSLVTLIKLFSPLIFFIRPWVSFDFFMFISSWLLVGLLWLAMKFLCRTANFSALTQIKEPNGFLGFGILIFGVGVFWGQDLAPLGLDTHTHITYTQHILEAGYLPLEARTTSIIDNYVKSAHALAAAWSGLGLYAFAGPYFKIMPLIQFALVVIFLFETLMNLIQEKRSAGWRLIVGGLALGLIFLFGVVGTQGAYPIPDLNGAPRIIALSLVIFPMILVWAGVLHDEPNIILSTLLLLPWLGGLALTCNPVVTVALCAFVLPAALLGLLFLYVKGQRVKLERVSVWRLTIPLVPAFIAALYDPFVINKILDLMPGVAAFIQTGFGLTSHSLAIAQGLINKEAIVDISNTTHYTCQGLNCLSDAITKAIQQLPSYSWESLEKSYPPLVETMHAHVRELWKPLVFGLASLALLRVVLEKFFQGRVSQMTSTFLLAVSSVYIGIVLLKTIGYVLIEAVGSLSLEGRLLGQYTLHYAAILKGPLVTMMFLWSGLLWAMPLINGRWKLFSNRFMQPLMVGVGFLIYVQVISQVSKYRPDVPPNNWALGPVLEKDIREMWKAEAKIPMNERIVVPSFYMFIDRQHWILPVNTISGFLPYSRRKLAFNVYIGESLFWNWHHLDELCASEAKARELLLAKGISWFLIPAPTELALEHSFHCKSANTRSFVSALAKGQDIRALPFANGRAQFVSFDIDPDGQSKAAEVSSEESGSLSSHGT